MPCLGWVHQLVHTAGDWHQIAGDSDKIHQGSVPNDMAESSQVGQHAREPSLVSLGTPELAAGTKALLPSQAWFTVGLFLQRWWLFEGSVTGSPSWLKSQHRSHLGNVTSGTRPLAPRRARRYDRSTLTRCLWDVTAPHLYILGISEECTCHGSPSGSEECEEKSKCLKRFTI